MSSVCDAIAADGGRGCDGGAELVHCELRAAERVVGALSATADAGLVGGNVIPAVVQPVAHAVLLPIQLRRCGWVIVCSRHLCFSFLSFVRFGPGGERRL
jgi:hypothetical protein